VAAAKGVTDVSSPVTNSPPHPLVKFMLVLAKLVSDMFLPVKNSVTFMVAVGAYV